MKLNSSWSEIPGITESEAKPRLPVDPAIVVEVLAQAVERVDRGEAPTMPSLVEEVRAVVGGRKTRVEGMTAWLPVSRVARWNQETGQLELFPGTTLRDLAYRYAAWVGSRLVQGGYADALRKYIEGVQIEAGARESLQEVKPLSVQEVDQWMKGTAGWVEGVQPASRKGGAAVSKEIPKKIGRILAQLDNTFLERKQQIRAVFLALLSGQHALMLGPPGTAKSLLSRSICSCFQDAVYFEYLLSRFTHPDELFGPVSIPGLKNEDYRRITKGFLPCAHVAFLDEIFKANSAILNSLLTVINERIFHHGQHRDQVPLMGLIGASNEMPDPQGGLGALYDRFLVRLVVPPVTTVDSFTRVATGAIPPFELAPEDRLTLDEVEAIRKGAEAVEVPPPVQSVLTNLWRRASELEWGVSDRRWRQAVHLLRLAAATDGRTVLDRMDLLLLEPVLAPSPEQIPAVRDTILEFVRPMSVPEHDLRAQWTLLHGDRVAPVQGQAYGVRGAGALDWNARLEIRRRSLERFVIHHRAATEMLARHREAIEAVGESHLWMDALPIELLEPHIESARHLAQLLKLAERYGASMSDRDRLAAAVLEVLPLEKRLSPQQMDCVIVLEGRRVSSLGLSYRQWKRIRGETNSVPGLRVAPERFLNWLGGAVETKALVEQAKGWDRRDRLRTLEELKKLLSPNLVPRPMRLPNP